MTTTAPGAQSGARTTTTERNTMTTNLNHAATAAAAAATAEYNNRERQPLMMWLLWLFTGIFGGHRFYLGDYGQGFLMAITAGGLGMWTLFDALMIGHRRTVVNDRTRREVFARHGLTVS